MNNKLLLLFIILLLGLLLCSFLGGYGCKEGFTQESSTMNFTASNGSTAVVIVGGDGPSTATVTNTDGSMMMYSQTDIKEGPYGTSIFYTETNGGTAILVTANSGVSTFSTKDATGSNQIDYSLASQTTTDTSTTTSTSADPNSSAEYNNYNHYNGTSYPTIFYGPNGGTARIINTANNGTIVTTSSNGTTQIYYINKDTPNPTVASYYGPNGGSAKIITDSNGKKAVEIMLPNGTKIVYYADNIYQTTQDESMNQYNPDTVTTGSDYNNAFTSSSYYGPNGGEVNTVMGPAGNTYATYDSSAYYNSLPQGIPKSLIPQGQEDLYILKSQVVPPVCPACPPPIIECPNNQDNTKCPPCPPCSRCPEPSFECAKVPNYSAFNPDTMPVPVLNDFSGFGL